MRGGVHLGAAALAGVICCAVAASPAAAVTVRLGPPALVNSTTGVLCPTSPCSYVPGAPVAPTALLTAPTDGTITTWRALGSTPAGGTVALVVVRQDGDTWTATRTGPAATSLLGFPMAVSIPIEAGERIGVTLTASAVLGTVLATGVTRLLFEPALGATPASPNQTYTGHELQVNADVTLTLPTVTSLTPAAGASRNGAAVTIAGAHLANATSVTFDATAAVIVSNTNTTLVVRPPDHLPGAVDVVVRTPAGSTTARYRYVETPVVTDVTPARGPTAGGTRVVIRGSGFEEADRVAFGATAARIVSVAPTRIEATSPAHAAGSVDVTVSNLGVTSATSVADGFTYEDVPAPGPGPSGPSAPSTSPPALTRLAIAPRTLRPRTVAQITYRLDRAARVRFTVLRRVRGRLRQVRAFSARGTSGANARTFTPARLASGTYRLQARATDASARRSATRGISFRVRR